jgi:acyl-CoA thioesterase-2
MTSPDDAPLPWTDRDVPTLLALDRMGEDVFLARHNQANPNGVLFGGQVLGQAAAAAHATVPEFTMHSLHGYFLRAGAMAARVTFTVERLRDGRRFAARRVTASQQGKVIFAMIASFFEPQRGYEHQTPAPQVPDPETLQSMAEIIRGTGVKLAGGLDRLLAMFPIDVRPVDGKDLLKPGNLPRLRFWVRVPSAASASSPAMHQQILAYMSDHWLGASCLIPHRPPIADPHFEIASLDHAMWFHRPARTDEWLLYDAESPNARNGVNLARGLIYDRQGALVASVAQELLQAYKE